MQDMRRRNLVVGLAMLAAGLGYLYLTASLPRRAAVDAAFFPYVLAGAMVLLGALQVAASLRSGRGLPAGPEELPEEAPSEGPPSYRTVAITLLLTAGFVALLRPLGFPVAASLYLFFQFIALTPGGRRVPYPLYAALAVAASLIVFVLFRYGFQLLLPAGPFTPYLP